MAKAIEHGLNKINEIYDQGDLMCELSRTTILTRKTTDDGGQAYGKINVAEGTQWDPIKIPKDVLLEKCKLLGSDQIVGVVSGNRLSVYDIDGHHVRLIDVKKKGRVKTVENINAIAGITDKILVAESQKYNNLIHVMEYTGDAVMSLPIDQTITGMIPIRTGLVLVRLKEKIQAVEYGHYPRVEITDVITYGRTLDNICVKGGNNELYVMFVKAVTPKILEIHVLDDKYQVLHKTKITHTTSNFRLTAVYTSHGPGFLVIQMGSTISTYKCSFGLIKRAEGTRFLPTPVPNPDTKEEDSREAQDEGRDIDDKDSVASVPNTPTAKMFGPAIVASEDIKKSEKEKSESPGEAASTKKKELEKEKSDPAENQTPKPASPIPNRQNIKEATASQEKNETPSPFKD